VPDIEPLAFMTFPSLNNYFFRRLYMKPKSLAILPPTGYSQNQSFKALAWLSYMERELRLVQFFTARKNGERLIGGRLVDGAGWDSQGDKYVLQFHGCYWHGCPLHSEDTPLSRLRRQKTEQADAHLSWLAEKEEPYGKFTFIVMWECEYDHMCATNNEFGGYMKKFLRHIRPPLGPRSAVVGGRTNPIVHYIPRLPPGYRLYYLDFTR